MFVELDVVVMLIQVVIILVTSFIVLQLDRRVILSVTDGKIKVTRGQLIQVNRFFQILIISIAVILILWTFNIDVTGLAS